MTPEQAAQAMYRLTITNAYGWLRPGHYERDGECLTSSVIRTDTTLN